MEESPAAALLASRPGCAGDWLRRWQGSRQDPGWRLGFRHLSRLRGQREAE
jgi:hypothetical protein